MLAPVSCISDLTELDFDEEWTLSLVVWMLLS